MDRDESPLLGSGRRRTRTEVARRAQYDVPVPDDAAAPDDQGVDPEQGDNDGDILAGPESFLERILDPGVNTAKRMAEGLAPTWRRVTQEEPRWQVSVVLGVAIFLQIVLPRHLTIRPHWLLPAVQALLLLSLFTLNPGRKRKASSLLRVFELIMIAVVSLANAISAVLLIRGLLRGTESPEATELLKNGAAIWITNMIAFSLWYWQMDRGGPAERAKGTRAHPDFLFPQMQAQDLAPPDWQSSFVDYLYLSFTNATAFSPTDVLPMTQRAKLMMMLQTAVSLCTIALVISRAVNILR
ncbi:unannotated protein [freshwater metagenome]|uniref:Unannotated protein n=1 Tax=freshwater metagenome TaxID=449393 RepID=A0A6J7E7M9_9ZZZZ